MLRSISHEIEMIFKFLSTVKENPGINPTRIMTMSNGTFNTITGLKSILVSSGFCKIMGANCVSSNIEITGDGEKLLEFLERLITHN